MEYLKIPIALHNFRDRQIEKEIQPKMRFTDKTTLERVESYLKSHTQSHVEVGMFLKVWLICLEYRIWKSKKKESPQNFSRRLESSQALGVKEFRMRVIFFFLGEEQ